ncbi:uncharacterized protein LOC126822361 isoform X2 [Patella vulgata]|uniref:uncharacterized protein LOC126822361 isoform X2 n=1 Tax=Patella vulgata TaxID=6465 RepID=UPI0021800281|nr:uncharacterized protein LOC126822361 isoform X2 [Patella vulgata]
MASSLNRMNERSSTLNEMATKAQLTCILHLDSVKNEGAEPFTKTRWDKCRDVAEEWLQLDGNDQCIAAFFDTNGLITKDVEDTVGSGFGFHPTCYRRFTDKTRLLKAIKRCEKKAKLESKKKAASTVCQTETTTAISITTPPTTPPSSTLILKTKSVSRSPPTPSMIPPKKLKSHHRAVLVTTSTSSELGKSVLPDICIICKKKSKYVRVGATQKRDNLVQCESKTAGSLLQAAEQKKDDSILNHIRDSDCIAINVKYHRVCYKNYCRFLFDKSPHVSTVNEHDQLYSDVYAMFCEDVLQKKLIDNQDILPMTKLTEMFNNMVKDKIGENAKFIRADRLKYKIKKDFPQLTFCSQHRKNLSELVYIDALPVESFMDTLRFSTTEERTGTNESDVDLDVNLEKTLFDASLIIKFLLACPWPPTSSDLNTCMSLADKPGVACPWPQTSSDLNTCMSLADKPGVASSWPPTSSDRNMKSARDIVPLELFNFISWVTGSSEEPTLSEMVDVSDYINPKIRSICRDIVYLASGGRK